MRAENAESARRAAQRAEAQRINPPSPPRPATRAGPLCPVCGSPMAARLAKKGRRKGQHFWGCTRYPRCRGTKPMGGR
ncbi:topoisomerase DNA-binding C4 zinc finger domain-containing protein [Hypericibacter adhaerens]|uniref:topoisomerase DNA-binding C4 zinc finger domain-containing protein n=1 Tax=Hypericibacter adhaerens TaxID=2602016 RepID=UPI001CD9B750